MAPYVKYTKLETKFLVARVIHSDFSIIILPMLDYSCELHVIEVAFGIYWSPMQHFIDFCIGKPVMWTKEKFNNVTNCENKHRDLQNVKKNVRHLGVKNTRFDCTDVQKNMKLLSAKSSFEEICSWSS